MQTCSRQAAVDKIKQTSRITFLTGAGISTPSGIPDYRSLQGVYQGMETPEYLLSSDCLENEPQKFYAFVQQLYHPEAQANIIHKGIAQLAKEKNIHVVTQNIDGLHEQAGSKNCVHFHGSLYDCYCRNCGEKISWQDYMQSDQHQKCLGQIRPGIVLYGEGISQICVEQAIEAVQQAELIIIVGTSFQVHPFCDLIHYKNASAEILVINQENIYLPYPFSFLKEDAQTVFASLNY